MRLNFTTRFFTSAMFVLLAIGTLSSQSMQTITLDEGRIRQELSFEGLQKTVKVCGLLKGETYRVWAVQTNTCQPLAQLVGGKAPASTFDFVATSECVDMNYFKGASTCVGQMFLSVGCISLKKEQSLIEKIAALAVSDGYAAETLVKDIFIGGGCFDIENVVAIGPDAGRGRFGNGSSSIIIDDGIILESGNITNALGPNNSNSAGNNIGGGSDPDLALIATAPIFDAVGIEFDFTPTIDMMQFDYVFASEEYCEWVNSSFNDVFGFFISGPGISGPFGNNGANIATLPSGTPVAINNVNHLVNTGFFIPNQGNCGGYFNQADIQFDGYTVPLTAQVTLQACETYHIRLVVGDAGDGIYDSAVFLEANSFSAGNAISGEAVSLSTGTNQVYEQCNDGFVLFYRAAGDPSVPLIYEITLDPASTATPGVDYDPLPLTIVMPPFTTFIQIPLNVFADGIPEGVETIILTMENACSCDDTEIVIEILDSEPIQMNLPPQTICHGESVLLDPGPTGGTGNYTYQWSNGSTNPQILVTPTSAQSNYSVTVSDDCGAIETVSTTINVNFLPTALLTGGNNLFLCADNPNSSVNLTVNFSGTGPWSFVYAIDGITQQPITTSVNPYTLVANQPGIYTLESVVSLAANCVGTANGVAIVNSIEMSVDMNSDPVTCVLGGTLYAFPGGGIPNFNYNWSQNFPNQPVVVNVAAGNYSVTVTDVNGCSATGSVTVATVDELEMSYTTTDVNCANNSGGSIEIDADSGSQPINYNWSNGLPNSPTQTDLEAGTYYVTVFDNIGCTINDTIVIVDNSVLPAAQADNDDDLDCVVETTMVLGAGSATGPGITYLWTGPGITSGANQINANVNQAGTYILTVTNTGNGCTATASTEVLIDTAPPTAAANGNEISCTASQVQINGNGSTTGTDITYLWSGPGIVSGGTTLTPMVNAAGTYTIVVTNSLNGCTDDATAIVTQDNSIPVAVVDDPVPFNCNVSTQTLDGSGSTSGPGITYQWFNGGSPIPGATSTTLDVSNTGTYQIVVSDSNNGCTSNYSVTVVENLAQPVVGATADGEFTCTQTSVALMGTVNGNPNNFTFAWSTTNGSFTGGTNSPNATAASPGTYNLLVTNNVNGCTGTASVTVDQDASIPSVEIDPADELNCTLTQQQLDASNSSQGPDLTYAWTTQGGSFVMGETTLTPTIDAPGTYILTISNSSNNCESSAQVVVTEDVVLPNLTVAPVPTLNCNVTSLTFDAEVSNFPVGDLNIAWTTTNGTINGPTDILDASTSAPGTYVITVTNLSSGCSDSESIVVSQNIAQPVAIVAPADDLTCTNNTVTLNGNLSSSGANMGYLWTTPDGNFVTGATTLNPVVDQDGSYTLTVTNSTNGCTDSETVIVEQNASVPMAEAGPAANMTCTTSQLTLNGSGSMGAQYLYQWTGPGIVNNGSTLSPLIDQPGVYQLTVTNQTNQCSATDNVTIGTDFAAPTAEAGPGGELSCSVTSMALDGTGSSTTGVSYLWTSPNGNIMNGETTLSPNINAPGTYVLTVTNNGNGCTSSDQLVITEDDDLPVVIVAQSQPLTCNVESVTLDGTASQSGAGFTYVWNTNLGNIVSGGSTLTPTVDAPGTYTLTVTNTATNCSNIGSVTVAQTITPPNAEAGQPSQLTCTSTTATLNGAGSSSGANFTYQWSTTNGNIMNGGTTLTPTVNQAGTYQILVTNQTTGCTNTDQVTITQSANLPTAIANSTLPLTCVTLTTVVNASGSSTGGNITYQWSTLDGNILSGQNLSVATVNQPGTYTLTVSNSANSCTSTANVIVQQNIAQPTAEAGTASDLNCSTPTLTLDGGGSSTGATMSYLWSTTNGNIVSGGTTLTPTVNETGTYTITVSNSVNGCTSTDQVQVNEDQSFPQANIQAPDVLTCTTTSITLTATGSQGPDFAYQWTTTGGNIVSGGTTLQPVVDAPGTYTLLVTNSANGCTNSEQTTVTENVALPTANAGQNFIMDCMDLVNYLDGSGSTGNGGVTYSWSTQNGDIVTGANTAEPGVGQGGVYVLTVASVINGCTDTDEVTVNTDGPVSDPQVFQPRCYGDLGAIAISGVSGGVSPYQFSLDGGNTFTDQSIHLDLNPGLYEVVVQDANGCEYATDVFLDQPILFDIEIEDLFEMDLGESVQLQVQVNVPLDEIETITWTPSVGLSCDDCLDPIATPTETLLYHVEVETKNKCKDDDNVMLLVHKGSTIYVPNAFSPNGDGANDVFMVFSGQETVAKINSLTVFSRWGETVYQYYNFPPNDPTYSWDGMHRGELMNPAVFVWFAEVEFADGRIELFEGDVTLTR